MLQQTTVATVRPRFERFLARWPTLEALAAAQDEEILQEWAGLGYYARARNLIACAREVAKRGGFPRTAAGLRQLPGIGAYTSAAIAAIAFGECAPAVDTNVERVVARLHGLKESPRKEVEGLMGEMLPTDRPGDFVQAMMDLGATICRPRKPRCDQCPLTPHCVAFASNSPESFPERRKSAARPHRHGIAFWIERDQHVWLVRRPATGLLGGMPALPGTEWTGSEPPSSQVIGKVRHVFSHFSLDLHLVPSSAPEGEGWWQPLDQVDQAGLPALYRKAVRHALSSNDQRAT
ncbi:MAG TPA: A/G-specific adenine glycosylase [Sphingomicrobium sp.]|nr:A/G-specific adenine glycosylase [Sphingomicrobium sp.]